MPFFNQQASEYFESKNVASVENSIVTRIYKLAPHKSLDKDCLEKIKRSNFENYAPFHDKYAIPNEMYFNSKNLLAELDRFRIYVFKDAGEIRGSIFVSADKKLSDIYGLFMAEEYKRQGNEQILIHEMLAGLYSEFGTVEEIEMGFEIKEKYRLYKCAL